MNEAQPESQPESRPESPPKKKTPCIGICSTTSLGDTVCRGCKRYAAEVINWHNYDESAKRAVLQRIDRFIIQILQSRLRIFSVPNLRQGLQTRHVSYDASRSPYCWLHDLLKKAHSHFTRAEDLEEYGVYVREAYKSERFDKLCEEMERELLLLCSAHYERYISLQPAVEQTNLAPIVDQRIP